MGSRNSESTTWWCTYEKYIILSTLFCQLCPTENVNIISFSKFCSLCPKNVLLTGDTPQHQCKCMVHENLFSKPEALGHSYDRYESHILFGKYHATYLLGAYLPHSVWCIYLQPALRINWSVKFTLLLKAIGVAGMHLTLLSTTWSSWSKREYIKCWIMLMNIFFRGTL